MHDKLTKSWRAPYSSHICPSASVALTSVDGAEDKRYEHLPPLDESLTAHLCPPTTIGWKARASHPSKPCRATSTLAGCAYLATGQAASALHSMAVLQVFQAKMLANEEAGLDSACLRDMRRATDLALRWICQMDLLEKGAIEIVPPAQSESGFYSHYFLVLKKATYSRSQTPELRPDEKVVQDDHFETDPPANIPRGLVHVTGSERRVLSHPGSPPSQTILEIHIWRGGISIQGPVVWAIPGSPHFYTMHGCGSLPSATHGNPHTLPRLILTQLQVVLTSHKTLLLSHFDCLGLRVSFPKSILSPSQRVSFLGTVISAGWPMTIQEY